MYITKGKKKSCPVFFWISFEQNKTTQNKKQNKKSKYWQVHGLQVWRGLNVIQAALLLWIESVSRASGPVRAGEWADTYASTYAWVCVDVGEELCLCFCNVFKAWANKYSQSPRQTRAAWPISLTHTHTNAKTLALLFCTTGNDMWFTTPQNIQYVLCVHSISQAVHNSANRKVDYLGLLK